MNLENVSQTQTERLAHIDFRVYFLGDLGRGDLTARFGVGDAAATRDISLYRELAPGNLEYDTKAKSYVISDRFEPLFEYSPNQVLTALSQGFGEVFVGVHSPMVRCETPTELNKPGIPTLAVITRAIRLQKAVRIKYRSINSGLSSREIVPFVLVDNGLRWHVRSYDRKRETFIDFVITRILDPAILNGEPQEHESKDADIQWNRIVEMELVAHPSRPHPETIELDYGMQDKVLKVNVRAAVAGYVLRRWNVDCSEAHELEGTEYHLWLRNRQSLYGVKNLMLAPGYSKEIEAGSSISS